MENAEINDLAQTMKLPPSVNPSSATSITFLKIKLSEVTTTHGNGLYNQRHINTYYSQRQTRVY